VLFGIIVALTANRAGATASGISPTPNERVAWNDVTGWIDFNPGGVGTVSVSEQELTGYAMSSIGPISLDCKTSPNGSICAQSNYGICNGSAATRNTEGLCTNYDGTGRLSGYAWNDAIGWISFRGPQYEVRIDASGIFQGYAWNDAIGWIRFNGSYGTGQTYAVQTESWRPSSFAGTLDSPIFEAEAGSVLQSITWHGERNTGVVDFQIAAAETAAGPWNFMGPGGSSQNYYGTSCAQSFIGGIHEDGAQAGVATCIDPTAVKGKRFIRYRVQLRSDQAQTQTPRVDDIILNWSAP
jgi:hypothetical protein